MSAHTPGPWNLEDRDERLVVFADGFHDEIASFGLVFDCDDAKQASAVEAEQRANALMAAAAPEMYAALSDLCAPPTKDRRQWTESDRETERAKWKAALAAIAKAVGK